MDIAAIDLFYDEKGIEAYMERLFQCKPRIHYFLQLCRDRKNEEAWRMGCVTHEMMEKKYGLYTVTKEIYDQIIDYDVKDAKTSFGILARENGYIGDTVLHLNQRTSNPGITAAVAALIYEMILQQKCHDDLMIDNLYHEALQQDL